MPIKDTSIEIITNVERVQVDSDTIQTTVTGFIDVEKIIQIGDKVIFIEKKLPFSYMTIITSGSNMNTCNTCNTCD
ncbi:MAG TPA: hypothetical protein VLM92_14935 [Romboutsia sp.]|nr:hypothetical protein [Romboutsia sp.]